MPSAMLALSITLLTDFICLPTQLHIAQLSVYISSCNDTVRCPMLSARHLENSVLIDQFITTADLGTCATPDREHRASVCSHQSLYTYRLEIGAGIGTHNLVPALLPWQQEVLRAGSGLGKEIALALHRDKTRWTLLSTRPPVLLI